MKPTFCRRLRLRRVKLSGAPVVTYPRHPPAVLFALSECLKRNYHRWGAQFRVFTGWRYWQWQELPLTPWAIQLGEADEIAQVQTQTDIQIGGTP